MVVGASVLSAGWSFYVAAGRACSLMGHALHMQYGNPMLSAARVESAMPTAPSVPDCSWLDFVCSQKLLKTQRTNDLTTHTAVNKPLASIPGMCLAMPGLPGSCSSCHPHTPLPSLHVQPPIAHWRAVGCIAHNGSWMEPHTRLPQTPQTPTNMHAKPVQPRQHAARKHCPLQHRCLQQ